MEELVVLVDEKNNVLGTTPKSMVHTTDTRLHRGFSLFIFNKRGDFLLTQRALSKKTFPGVWTNTVCGHPGPEELPIEAAKRRLQEEMGMTAESIVQVSDYRYRFVDKNGIVENEICPVFMGYSEQTPIVTPTEIEAAKWVSWETFLKDIQTTPDIFSPWCREEAMFVNTYLLARS